MSAAIKNVMSMIKEPEFYRVEAERVRRKASTAPTQELRDQWQKLAAAYERLAMAAEDAARARQIGD